jgi:hypothetical protein
MIKTSRNHGSKANRRHATSLKGQDCRRQGRQFVDKVTGTWHKLSKNSRDIFSVAGYPEWVRKLGEIWRRAMTAAVATAGRIPWWKEPTKEQWLAWWAAWLGWTLDAFDFTVFLLIMVAIAKEFAVPLTEVAIVLTITLWMRLVGAVASGWLADRIGRKTPLMISILWYSLEA